MNWWRQTIAMCQHVIFIENFPHFLSERNVREAFFAYKKENFSSSIFQFSLRVFSGRFGNGEWKKNFHFFIFIFILI